jgi:hypothetical protein
VLEKASGDERFAVEQTEPGFEEVEGEIVARTHEIARWRETGEIAYERDFAVRLTLGDERIVRIGHARGLAAFVGNRGSEASCQALEALPARSRGSDWGGRRGDRPPHLVQEARLRPGHMPRIGGA